MDQARRPAAWDADRSHRPPENPEKTTTVRGARLLPGPLDHERPRRPTAPRRRRLRLTRRRFTERLFAWHATAERPLLIRQARTPWAILVAEVMSQQTGIDRVGPAWRRFVDTWPTSDALAS